MEVDPIPEVDEIEYKIPSPVIRDAFDLNHERGEGYS